MTPILTREGKEKGTRKMKTVFPFLLHSLFRSPNFLLEDFFL